jgi:predicted permease
VGAALLFRSFVTLRSEPLGFESRDRVSFAVAFKNDRPWETWDRIIARVEALPGVSAASGTSTLPLTSPTTLRFVPAELPADAPTSDVAFYSIAPNYFEVAGTRMVAGRAFASTDVPTSARVAIINEAYALAHYRNRNPVGRQLRGLDADRPPEIVGVVRNVVQARVEDGARPAVYLPHTQAPAVLNVVAVTRRDPEGLMPDLRRALAEEGMWNAPVLGLMTLEARVGRALASPRFQMLLIAAFAGVAVLLAAIGLYGTLSYSVRSRTRELGIRMAMGASEQQILGLVWRQGMRVMLFGLVAGLAGAFVLTRVMRGLLFRISTTDPVAFAAALAAIVVAVVVASLWPARRAARLDPMSTIRTQT